MQHLNSNNETQLHLLFPPFSMHESGEQNPHWLGVPPLPLVPTLHTYLAVLDLFMGMHWRWLVTPMRRGKRQRLVLVRQPVGDEGESGRPSQIGTTQDKDPFGYYLSTGVP